LKTGRTHLLGIRHHGPGSAASVLAALDEIKPQIVLIEGPVDANSVLEYASLDGMKPPVAILVHVVDDPAKATFFPFAEYSPEWQALQWALARNRPVRFIDLPYGQHFSEADEGLDKGMPALYRDPLSALAEAAGESDGESWWNGLVEQSAGDADVFGAIANAMTALRAESEREFPTPRREVIREAKMRLEIAIALGETEGEIAVICGAWHVPALALAVPAKQDRETLKGHSSQKTTATWVPWTDSRLAAASGYGAGVISPGWYRHLWQEFQMKGHARQVVDVAARWQSSVAGLLRDEGQLTSSASVIEAARLSISLASLREHPFPGLTEMQDASLSVMCHGNPILLRLIADRLVIGNEIGEIADGIPQMPLAEDLQRWQRKLRLKPSAFEEELSVDLRSEAGLLKSELLHRLLLIDVRWGSLKDAQAGRGTFRENWMLVWQPELSIKLAEAMRYGATIEQAAGNAALEAAEQTVTLSRCAEVISLCLNANLPEAAEKLTRTLQALSVDTADIEQLLRATPPLINILRYGTARKLPREALLELSLGMCVEISAGLGMASRGLNEEAATGLLAAMRGFDAALPLLEDTNQLESWRAALAALETDDLAAPMLRGFSLRRLYDAKIKSENEVATRLSCALSSSVPTLNAGQWLEGFLNQSAQLLIHDSNLFYLIDDWLIGINENAFIELLPVMRRAVSAFDIMERRSLLEKVKSDVRSEIVAHAPSQMSTMPHAFEKALPLLKTILGLE
jgi:Family of unknown function (DUF5682)